MSLIIKVLEKGPLLISDAVELVDAKTGKNIKVEKFPCAICRCGKTGNQPFCDGSHSGCFEGTVAEALLD